MSFSYSVAIRTLGTAGEKYVQLIDSVLAQSVQPEKIIVVLPEGYDEPEYKTGKEQFVYSPKGMIEQRLFAVNYIDSEYILFCDDDVAFPDNFVDKLSDALLNKGYDCAAGPLLSFLPPKGLKYLIASIPGGACVMIHGRSKQYVRLLNTGGWSYNRSVKTDQHLFYDTDSLAWTCFCVKKKSVEAIHFQDEVWAGRNGYAAYDDQLFFTKLKLNGFRSCVVSDALYVHNDGKTSTENLKLEPMYAHAHNHYVFWHRCLYAVSRNPIKKLWMIICVNYYIFMKLVYALIKPNGGTRSVVFNTKKKAFRDAKKYVKSDEYLSLPSIFVQ